MEQKITAIHNPTGKEHIFSFAGWIANKSKTSPSGGKLYKFVSVNKTVATTRGLTTTPPSAPPKKRGGCGCGK